MRCFAERWWIELLKIRKSIEARVKKFDEAICSAKSERVASLLLRDKKRWLCRNDLFYLCCLTGNRKIAVLPEVFRDYCDEVSLMNWLLVYKEIFPPSEGMLEVKNITDDPDKDFWYQRLYLCHRGFFKTTINIKVHSLQLLLNFPNIKICLLHNKQENSSANLCTIKDYFTETYVRTIFPEFIPVGADGQISKEWGNLRSFSVANRTDVTRSEDSVEAIGEGTEITGRHWDIAKKDDIVTQDSVTTEDQVLKTRNYDDRFNAGHFTDNVIIQDYSGTRYAFNDRYSDLIGNPSLKKIEIPLEDGQGNPTHLLRFSREDIERIKRGCSSIWVYSCQHLLKPQDPAKISFTPEMISYYDRLPEFLNFYLLVDPARVRNKDSDYTAMKVVGVDKAKNRYIADMVRDKLSPDERINAAIDLIRKWKPLIVGWEEVGLGNDTYYLEEKRRELKLPTMITPIKSMKVSKEDRIRQILVPEYAERRWFWPIKGAMIRYSKYHGRNFDMTEVLEDEFLHFPLGAHDDLLETGSFLAQLPVVYPDIDSRFDGMSMKGMTFGELVGLKETRQKEEARNPWIKFPRLSRV